MSLHASGSGSMLPSHGLQALSKQMETPSSQAPSAMPQGVVSPSVQGPGGGFTSRGLAFPVSSVSAGPSSVREPQPPASESAERLANATARARLTDTERNPGATGPTS